MTELSPEPTVSGPLARANGSLVRESLRALVILRRGRKAKKASKENFWAFFAFQPLLQSASTRFPERDCRAAAEALRLKRFRGEFGHARARHAAGGILFSLILSLFAFACSSPPAKATPEGQVKSKLAFERGISQAKAGKIAEAEAFLRQALDYDQDNLNACLALGGLLAQSGRLEDAIKMYQAAIAHFGSKPELFEDLASAQERNGDKPGAIDSLRKALEIRNKLPQTPDNKKWIDNDQKGIAQLSDS